MDAAVVAVCTLTAVLSVSGDDLLTESRVQMVYAAEVSPTPIPAR